MRFDSFEDDPERARNRPPGEGVAHPALLPAAGDEAGLPEKLQALGDLGLGQVDPALDLGPATVPPEELGRQAKPARMAQALELAGQPDVGVARGRSGARRGSL
jgi:hypothetical protein